MASEFAGPFTFGQHYTAVVFFEILIGLCVLSALGALRRLDLFTTALLLSQLGLALTSIRNLPLFCLAAIPFVARCAAETKVALPRSARVALPAIAIAVCAFYSWSLATDRFNVRQNDSNQFGAGLAQHRFPEDATAFLRSHPTPGRTLNTMFEGSYLVAHGVEVFIDPRLEIPDRGHLERYLRMMQDESAWRDAVAQLDVGSAIVDLQSPFLRFLLDGRAWTLVYFDEVAAVFVRAGASAPPAADVPARISELREKLGPPRPFEEQSILERVDSPLPYLRLADFAIRVGRADLAEPLARDALTAYPHVPGAHAALGQILEGRADLDGALRDYEAELTLSPSNVRVRRQAGVLHFKAGRPDKALPLLERSVAEIPEDAQAWAVLTKIHADAGRKERALACARKAAELEPTHAEYVKNLGRLLGESGKLGEGIATLERGIALDPRFGGDYADLAAFLLRAGRLEEARRAVERGTAIAPADPLLLRLRERITSARP